MAYDWLALKAEFLASSETVNEFRKRKAISKDTVYRRAKEDKWLEERQEIRTNAAVVAKQNLEGHLVAEYGSFLPIWEKAKERLFNILNGKENVSAREVRDAMAATDLIYKDVRLLKGQSTANTMNLNLHQVIISELQKVSDRPGTFSVTKEDLDDRSLDEELPVETLETSKFVSD